MIQVNNLSVSFRSTEVLHNISCEFPKGAITGLMGRNGSGKTVLLKTICGLVAPSQGEVLIYGKKLTPKNMHTFSIGMLIESPGFLREYSGLRNLQFIASLNGRDSLTRASAAMQRMGLDPKSKKHVGKYSLGMRQRLGIAQAIMDDPEILILDEPMNGLDQECMVQLRTMLHQLAEQGKTIIIASHFAEDLQNLCSHIFQVKDGCLIEGGEREYS